MINYKDSHTENLIPPEEEYQVAVALREYLSKKSIGSLSEYILDFCKLNSYNIEAVAEIIEKDKIFKSILKEDCIFHKIFKTDKNVHTLDSW